MNRVDELSGEVAKLREDLDHVVRLLRWEVRQREAIERYLETVTSSREWKPWERKFNFWFPMWGWLAPLRVLYREPYSVWVEDRLRENRHGQE